MNSTASPVHAEGTAESVGVAGLSSTVMVNGSLIKLKQPDASAALPTKVVVPVGETETVLVDVVINQLLPPLVLQRYEEYPNVADSVVLLPSHKVAGPPRVGGDGLVDCETTKPSLGALKQP